MFDTLLEFPQLAGPLTLTPIIINIVLAFVLCLIVAIVYRNTHKGLSYSQSFTFTLVLIGTFLAVIMMVIGNSLATAFGAFGAFSLIRFRSAIKDTKDIAFILLVVTIGLAVGTANYLIAVILTVLAVMAIYIMTKMNFGAIRKYDFLLNFTADHDSFSNDMLGEVFNEFLKYNNLLNVASRENGKILDYSFNIKFIKDGDVHNFVEKLSRMSGVNNVDVIASKNDIEY